VLAGGEEDEDASPPQGDLFAMVAQRQQALLARVMIDAQRLVSVQGMQAYCLECPAPAAARRIPGKDLGWLASLVAAKR
jgi:protease-4